MRSNAHERVYRTSLMPCDSPGGQQFPDEQQIAPCQGQHPGIPELLLEEQVVQGFEQLDKSAQARKGSGSRTTAA